LAGKELSFEAGDTVLTGVDGREEERKDGEKEDKDTHSEIPAPMKERGRPAPAKEKERDVEEGGGRQQVELRR
jgi:hypothetical protein